MMNLPARTEGPHRWLWLLIYAEAERGLGLSADAQSPAQAAGLLWERILAGEVCVRRDRSGVVSGEIDPWLKDLVAEEAGRHIRLSAELDRGVAADSPERAAKDERPQEERVRAISAFIWRQLGNGWARVADGEDAILFWDPEGSGFVPFGVELSRCYARRFSSAARPVPR